MALKSCHTHLIRLYLGGNSSVVYDLKGQEVELDVGVCDTWLTADEPSTLQVGCCAITYGTIIMLGEKVGLRSHDRYIHCVYFSLCLLSTFGVSHKLPSV